MLVEMICSGFNIMVESIGHNTKAIACNTEIVACNAKIATLKEVGHKEIKEMKNLLCQVNFKIACLSNDEIMVILHVQRKDENQLKIF